MKKMQKRSTKKSKASSTKLDVVVGPERVAAVPFTVVGIGASAGGLDALTRFFDVMPSDSGMSFVVIQHLAPDNESMLAEIIGRHTRMAVAQVKDEMKLQPNRVYVIRPGRTLTLRRGVLSMGKPINTSVPRHPVDDFFRSLAEEQQEGAVCIVMSGMGSNGTAGAESSVKADGVTPSRRQGQAADSEPAAQPPGKMEELENSTNDINSLLSSTDIAVVFLDRQFRIRKFTPAVKDLFELIDSDVGRPLSDLALKFTDLTLSRDIGCVLANGTALEAEVNSSSGRTYMRRVLPYRKNGSSMDGVVVTFVDISARKLAEMEMRRSESIHRLILRGIKEYGIFMMDLAGNFVTWTPGAEHIFGYSEKEALGQHLRMIQSEENRTTGMVEKELTMARAGNDVFIERWHQRKDGTRFWGTGILSILNDENNQPYGFVKVVRDNTDRKVAEDALHHAMQQAEAANASKDHFLANVSHELRTPLSATMLWAKLLLEQDEIEPDLLREGLNAIARSSKEQQMLIEDLMDTAKIVAGKLRLEASDFGLNRLIETFLPAIRTIGTEKSIVIETELDPEIGTIKADPRRIQQVISNLLNNAIKFTPSGGRVHIRTLRKGETVEIRIADNGQGIKKEFLSRIFDRFIQLEQGSTPTASGMGLGLAICKQLVEMHGGSIRAESPGKDQGAEFIVVLPLPRRQASPEDAWALPPPSITLRGWRILLIEDAVETRHALKTVLMDAGAEVAAVGTAKAALQEFDRNTPDLILSDIGLGGMSGHELIAEIRRREREKERPAVPAVALTAYADEKNFRKAFESGFQECLAKPVEPLVLIGKLANLAANR